MRATTNCLARQRGHIVVTSSPPEGHLASTPRSSQVEHLACHSGAVKVVRSVGPPTPLPKLAESWLRPERVGIQDACGVRNVKAGCRCYQEAVNS